MKKSSGSSTNSSGDFIKKRLKLADSVGRVGAELGNETSQGKVKLVKSLEDKSVDVLIWD